jgi:hypothetical protein
LDVRLRREEVIAVILYTGPMYMMYNCVLARWSNPAAMWDTLRRGNNLFTTTLSVLVSAVQKLSSITVIPDGLKLYRGTGGLVYLPGVVGLACGTVEPAICIKVLPLLGVLLLDVTLMMPSRCEAVACICYSYSSTSAVAARGAAADDAILRY